MLDSSSPRAWPSSPGTRRPYRGSCHCGFTKFIAFLTLPPSPPDPSKTRQQLSYRCNCTLCHKSNFFHVRLEFSPDDFMLLEPSNGPEALGDYKCFSGKTSRFFCKTCGGRCFALRGEGEFKDVDLNALGIDNTSSKDAQPATTRVWRPKREGWNETIHDPNAKDYLTVNGFAIDAGQEGFDLREWTELKWVTYLEGLNRPEAKGSEEQFDRPYPYGAY